MQWLEWRDQSHTSAINVHNFSIVFSPDLNNYTNNLFVQGFEHGGKLELYFNFEIFFLFFFFFFLFWIYWIDSCNCSQTWPWFLQNLGRWCISMLAFKHSQWHTLTQDNLYISHTKRWCICSPCLLPVFVICLYKISIDRNIQHCFPPSETNICYCLLL